MFMSLLGKVIVASAVLGVVSGVASSKATPLTSDVAQVPSTADNPQTPMPVAVGEPPSSTVMKIMDQLGLTKKARQPLPPIYIPKDLTGKTDKEIMSYAFMLLKQRRALQRRMTRHMAYSGFLMLVLHLFGSRTIVKGGVAGLFWLNNNYRATINADWMVHQEQLGEFIVEYARVNKVKLNSLSNNAIVGAPLIRVPYTEKDSIDFPVWMTAKDQHLPINAEIRAALPMIRNWWLRK